VERRKKADGQCLVRRQQPNPPNFIGYTLYSKQKVTRFGDLRGCDSANTTTNGEQTMQLQPHRQPKKTIRCHTYSNEKLPGNKFNKCLVEIMKTFYIKK